MNRMRQYPVLAAAIVLALAMTLVIGGYGVFLASEAGRLPWQVDPTRIPVTPFADFPGFGATTTPPAIPGAS